MCVRVSERQSSLSLLATGNMYVGVCVCVPSLCIMLSWYGRDGVSLSFTLVVMRC